MRVILYISLAFLFAFIDTPSSFAQELFVYSEPASNMPAKSLGLRANNWFMNNKKSNWQDYRFIPELMWGVNKDLMVHAEGFFSNNRQSFTAEGGALYAKYRFFSRDSTNRHFRMAAFARTSISSSPIDQEEIETNSYNSGYGAGIIATRLLHKLAYSATLSFEQVFNNSRENKLLSGQPDKALGYCISAGRLIFPIRYKTYNQTNLNVLLELPGQYQPQSGRSFADLAPSLQMIFFSQLRVDLGYRRQLYSNMLRSSPESFLVRIEYTFFNAFR